MCDTFVAVPPTTKDGSVIFGKNSDRQPNEPQEILQIAGRRTEEDTLRCTYIEIPQVEETHSIAISKPSWMWGAEMGMNEFGVTIGNEAVWTIFDRENREERLLGMDMIRIALERAKTAVQAFDIITDLLQTYGQGGNCGFDEPFYYDNSFIIADPQEAWVLETAGSYWIGEKVEGIRSISNTLTIESKYDRIHPDLISYAIENDLCDDETDFNFKKQFSDRFNLNRIGAKGEIRAACTRNRLQTDKGEITISSAFDALRDHNTDDKSFNPRKSSMRSPCLHASSLLTPSQSTASMVGHLTIDRPLAWMTGTSSPCISLFKPIDPSIDITLQRYSDTYSSDKLWWDHEILHRMTLSNYSQLSDLYLDELREYEKGLLERIKDIEVQEIFREFTEEVFQFNLEFIHKWIDNLEEIDIDRSLFGFRYRRYWNKLNNKSEIPVST